MTPAPDPPAFPTDAYEDFWAAVDADPGTDPPLVTPYGPAPEVDAYAAFADLTDS